MKGVCHKVKASKLHLNTSCFDLRMISAQDNLFQSRLNFSNQFNAGVHVNLSEILQSLRKS